METNSFAAPYDVAADGQRFLMLVRAGGPQSITVIHGWN